MSNRKIVNDGTSVQLSLPYDRTMNPTEVDAPGYEKRDNSTTNR